jgi:hypothetical protein
MPRLPLDSPRARVAAAAVAVVALLTGLALVAGGDDGGGEGAQRTTTTATSTVPATERDGAQKTVPTDGITTEVATALVPQVDVLEELPPPPIGPVEGGNLTPATSPPGPHPAIPRDGYGSAGASKIPGGWRFDNPTYWGSPLVFTVTEHRGDWLRVRVPTRPNNQQGWVKASDVSVGTHTYRIRITLSTFRMEVYDGPDLWIDTQVVIGTQMTPTPLGTYYLTEKLATAQHQIPYGSYGSWVLPTNGYSEALDEFDGGMPVIALHGTINPATVGQARSNGCIRIPDEIIVQMAEKLPAGTPVEVVP